MSTGRFLLPWAAMALLCVWFVPALGQTCNVNDLSHSSNKLFTDCAVLHSLNTSLYWNLNSTTKVADIGFRKSSYSSSNWIAWGLNPNGSGMIGVQTLVAYSHSNGTTLAYPSPVTGYGTKLERGELSFPVTNISSAVWQGDLIIFATLQLDDTIIVTNQLWQEGTLSDDIPQQHSMDATHTSSTGKIDFSTGSTTIGSVPNLHKKNVHGVLNAVSWGTMMPMGVMLARYLRVFKATTPAWFYIHASTQFSAYVIGVAGWATGMSLSNDNSGKLGTHRNIGITLFVLGTLQVFALLLRPKPDHKYRQYWNLYHHIVGGVTIILSIVNVYKGLDILDPAKKWKKIYTGILIFLGAMAIILEAVTFVIVMNRKKRAAAREKASNGQGVRA